MGKTISVQYTAGHYGFTKPQYRKEVSRLSAIANKRIARLENRDLVNSPAYKKFVEDGGAKFGVKGKTHNEVQQEMSRLTKFLNSKTSTIRGINKTLKDMATNIGVKYKNMVDLRAKSDNFFRLADKVEEYLRTVSDMASAIGYNKIWEVINEYVEAENIDLGDANLDIDDLTSVVTDLIDKSKSGNDASDYDFTNGFVFLE